jgi:hypothetical protein
MPTPYKLTVRKQNEFRRQKAAFKKLTDEGQKRAFLASCEWWPMEFWQKGQKGFRWYPTAVGIIMLDDAHPFGFETADEAHTHGQVMRAEYAQPAAASAL